LILKILPPRTSAAYSRRASSRDSGEPDPNQYDIELRNPLFDTYTMRVDIISNQTTKDDHAAKSKEPRSAGAFSAYEVRKKIGRGGFATVYSGFHASLERLVAIGSCGYGDAVETKERFLREAKAMWRSATSTSPPFSIRPKTMGSRTW
jgi:hypothetical protein